MYSVISIVGNRHLPTDVLSFVVSNITNTCKELLVPTTTDAPYNQILHAVLPFGKSIVVLQKAKDKVPALEHMILKSDCAVIIKCRDDHSKAVAQSLRLVKKYKVPYYLFEWGHQNKQISGKHFKWA